jgi:hypothetical protein
LRGNPATKLRSPLQGRIREARHVVLRNKTSYKICVPEPAIAVTSLEKSFPPTRSGWRAFLQPFEKATAVRLTGISLEVREGEAVAGDMLSPISILPHWLQFVGRIHPVTYALDGMRASLLSGTHLAGLWRPVGVLL